MEHTFHDDPIGYECAKENQLLYTQEQMDKERVIAHLEGQRHAQEAARTSNDEVRRLALEEAAQVAASHVRSPYQPSNIGELIANAIRDLAAAPATQAQKRKGKT